MSTFSDKDFGSQKCNKETVDLDPVEHDDDLTLLHDLLSEFKDRTGSQVAERLLNEWPAAAARFVKVPFSKLFSHTSIVFFLERNLIIAQKS